jgi:glycosyltransferase involved in cell wall biosynthesis
VNYNTINLTAAMLFSIFRVLGRDKVVRIVAVDNNSTDGSKELLELFAEQGLIDLIVNRKQNYHGPAINQAISFLATLERRGGSDKKSDYIWILDSDIVILRNDIIFDSVNFMEEHDAAAIGQFQYDALAEGYAHISSLMINPAKTWKRKIVPFDNSGAPAANFQQSLRAHGLKVCDFPYRSEQYLLHLSRGTLKSIYHQRDRENIYYQWATTHAVHHYHGAPNGRLIHEYFLEIFEREVPQLSPEALLGACLRPDQVKINLPAHSISADLRPLDNL